ncbi:hypothetical protein SAMN05428995_105337 [Loktanella sp. DSM 29012]|uniref:hypothetical protein n=1 Tax=Loktanella sp. DSM 29012 TaxID=1881056 RepID=UPI0008C12091|nr:hypothetical protein [Loktanella sp. DSM 29012]SEQ62376.1 hypothetical protein SAMN05428995_105337 [Loktanella sp. DSM 29012]
MTVTRLFSGTHLRADLMQTGAADLIVTFDWRVIGRRGFTDMTPNQRFLDAGYDQLMIATSANDWFINRDTTALERALDGVSAQYDAVLGIGFSMGGYGAVRFSRTLGIQRIVAVSPQVSISHAHAPFEWRYREEAAGFDPALGDLTQRADPDLTGHLLLDPLNGADLAHGRALQVHCPGLRLVRLTGAGHPASGLLRAVKRAGRIPGLLLDPEDGLRPLLQDHRTARRGQPDYWARLAAALDVRRPALAAKARAKAADLASQMR